MSSPEEMLKDIDHAQRQEQEREARELYEGLKADFVRLNGEGHKALDALMYRETDYPHVDRPAELAWKLSVEQVADLVRTATDDPQERFEAMSDFARIFARRAMSSAASSVTQEERITAAFELQAWAAEELFKGAVVIPA